MTTINVPPAHDGSSVQTGRYDASRPGFMTPEAQAFYADQGYLIAEHAVSEEEVDALLDDAAAICRGQYGRFRNWAQVDESMSDAEVLKQFLCIHFPHKCSPVMLEAVKQPTIIEVLTSVIGPDVKCMQSMLFIKATGKPGQAWHQDEDFIPTRDRSLCGAWLALDGATIENGCLWVIPGSHKPGVLWPQRVQDDRRFDCTDESHGFPYSDEDAVPVEVPKGSIVFFNGYLLHRSLPNTSGGYRRALVNHYMSASSLLPWYSSGGLEDRVAVADHRDIVMVAGKDPYAYKGTVDSHTPGVRRSGEGGCHKGDDMLPEATASAKSGDMMG